MSGGEGSKERVRAVSKLRVGEDLFLSTGYSYVKVTRGGQVEVLKLPIQSTGMAEVMERIRANEPKPPSNPKRVEPDTEVGRAMKLSKTQFVNMPDLADPEYTRAMAQYQQDLTYEIIGQGLALEIYDVGGELVTDRDGKIKALRSLGMSITQFTQIANDIQDLTTMTSRDREAFFGRSSEATPTP